MWHGYEWACNGGINWEPGPVILLLPQGLLDIDVLLPLFFLRNWGILLFSSLVLTLCNVSALHEQHPFLAGCGGGWTSVWPTLSCSIHTEMNMVLCVCIYTFLNAVCFTLVVNTTHVYWLCQAWIWLTYFCWWIAVTPLVLFVHPPPDSYS